MKTDSFTGIIDENGKHPRFTEWIKSIHFFLLSRKGKLIELPYPKVVSRKRSDAQNRYMRALYGLLESVGYTADEWHDMMRSLFLFRIDIVGNTEIKYLISTTTLTTVEMSDYIEKIRDWQQKNIPECYLPTPKEWEEWERGEYANVA